MYSSTISYVLVHTVLELATTREYVNDLLLVCSTPLLLLLLL